MTRLLEVFRLSDAKPLAGVFAMNIPAVRHSTEEDTTEK